MRKTITQSKMTPQKRYVMRHAERGLCVKCPNPAVPGILVCEKCREKQHIINIKSKPRIVKKYKEQRRCIGCSAPLESDDKVTCMNCRCPATKYSQGGVWNGTN